MVSHVLKGPGKDLLLAGQWRAPADERETQDILSRDQPGNGGMREYIEEKLQKEGLVQGTLKGKAYMAGRQ